MPWQEESRFVIVDTIALTEILRTIDANIALCAARYNTHREPADGNRTGVRLTIRTANLDSLSSALAKYHQDGFAIQQKYKEIVSIDPSSASLMLSQDFDLTLWEKLLNNLRLR